MSRDIRWTEKLHNQVTAPSTDNDRQNDQTQEGDAGANDSAHIPSEEGNDDSDDSDDDNDEDKNNNDHNDDNNNTDNNNTNPPPPRYNLRPQENKVQTSLMAIRNQAKSLETSEVGIADCINVNN